MRTPNPGTTYFEAWIGADLFGTPQAPRETTLVRGEPHGRNSLGKTMWTFYYAGGGRFNGAKVIVPVVLERTIPVGTTVGLRRCYRGSKRNSSSRCFSGGRPRCDYRKLDTWHEDCDERHEDWQPSRDVLSSAFADTSAAR